MANVKYLTKLVKKVSAPELMTLIFGIEINGISSI